MNDEYATKNDVDILVGRKITGIAEVFGNPLGQTRLAVSLDDGSTIYIDPDMTHSNGLGFHVDDIDVVLHSTEDADYDPDTMDEDVFDGAGKRVTDKAALDAHGATARNAERRQKHEERRVRRRERLDDENTKRKAVRKGRKLREKRG